ncbi:hypothetical protein D3C81_1760190 [compost metagenome]
MLFLVFADRHLVGLVQQDIRRHQYRVAEQAGVNVLCITSGFVLELGHAAQFAEIGVAVQHPAQLRVFRYVRLHEDGAFLRIDTTGQIQRQRIERGLTQFFCILTYGDRMQVNDAVDAVVIILHFFPLTQCTHVVANGQFTGRLRAAKYDGLTHV